MHPLHDYVARQVIERLKARRIVVWYDPRREFGPFVTEALDAVPSDRGPRVRLGDREVYLAQFAGSMFELRASVEPLVAVDDPAPLLIYLPGLERDRHGSVLMELERAGECYEPQLKRLARNVLRQRYTDGVIDQMLASDHVTYEDLARACSEDSSEPPSLLKSIFHPVTEPTRLLAVWLAEPGHDVEIEAKLATPELAALVRARLGLNLPTDANVGKLRTLTLRYVLAGEFRSDLRGESPASIAFVPVPTTKDAESAVRQLARTLRQSHADAYANLADSVERELRLHDAGVTAESLGSIDTFRFEERLLLDHCGALIVSKSFDAALALIGEREHSFWLDREVERKAHWEACRRMAELGCNAVSVRAAVAQTRGGPEVWLAAYVGRGREDGSAWYRLDQAQRRLETWVASLHEDPNEKPLAVVRRAYEDACHDMAEGFTRALVGAHWTVPAALPQQQIHADVIAPRPKPVAYFLVDAMRFEMGVELAERLPATAEASVRHAVGALPSITPIGMAALQPGASASFSVVEQAGRLGVHIDGVFLPDLASRRKFAVARVPGLVDVTLDEVLSLRPSKLAKKLEGATLVVVRSQEIDQAGEGGFTFQARQVMDTVIDNIARAVRKLAAAGVEQAVVTADHGHLFFPSDRDESMRIDSPGGDQVELHRRCWIGRGGWTPTACVRVAASALGYDSDLEFVFPSGCGVFKAGGDLAYHHGGPSLQELIVPVVTVRTRVAAAGPADKARVVATGLPDAVTNRIFSVSLQLAQELFASATIVRPLLMAGTRQVGSVGMAVDAEFDRAAGTVSLVPGKAITVALLLTDDTASDVRVVVQDPTTDAELYRSPADIPVRLGV